MATRLTSGPLATSILTRITNPTTAALRPVAAVQPRMVSNTMSPAAAVSAAAASAAAVLAKSASLAIPGARPTALATTVLRGTPTTTPPVTSWVGTPASGTLLPMRTPAPTWHGGPPTTVTATGGGWIPNAPDSGVPSVPPAGGPAASTAGTGTSNGTVTPASLGPSGAGYDPGSMTQPNPDNMITAGPAAGASSGIPWGKVALIGGAGLVAYFLFFRNG